MTSFETRTLRSLTARQARKEQKDIIEKMKVRPEILPIHQQSSQKRS